MKKLQEVIKTLIAEGIAIDLKTELLTTFDKNEDALENIVINPMYKFTPLKNLLEIQIREYCIISICSFIDEYDKFFTSKYIEVEYEQRIDYLKKRLKPFFKEIKREYNLKDYRNHILAHNLRDNSKSLLMGDIERTYNFPKHTEEFVNINEIIKLITRIIIYEFKLDLPIDYWDDKVVRSEKIKFNREKKEFNLENLKNEAEIILKKNNCR